jgi:hypothetical protein
MLIFFLFTCNKIIRVNSTLAYYFVPQTVYWCYIFLWSDLSSEKLLLLGTLLQLLTRIYLSTYKDNQQPFITIDFFKTWNIIVTLRWKN